MPKSIMYRSIKDYPELIDYKGEPFEPKEWTHSTYCLGFVITNEAMDYAFLTQLQT